MFEAHVMEGSSVRLIHYGPQTFRAALVNLAADVLILRVIHVVVLEMADTLVAMVSVRVQNRAPVRVLVHEPPKPCFVHAAYPLA